MPNYKEARSLVLDSLDAVEAIFEQENGEGLLSNLSILARQHPQAFDWLVEREGGLFDQVLAAFPPKVEDKAPAGELIHFDPREVPETSPAA